MRDKNTYNILNTNIYIIKYTYHFIIVHIIYDHQHFNVSTNVFIWNWVLFLGVPNKTRGTWGTGHPPWHSKDLPVPPCPACRNGMVYGDDHPSAIFCLPKKPYKIIQHVGKSHWNAGRWWFVKIIPENDGFWKMIFLFNCVYSQVPAVNLPGCTSTIQNYPTSRYLNSHELFFPQPKKGFHWNTGWK